MKKTYLLLLVSITPLLAGCTGWSSNTITVQDLTFSLPTSFQTISSATLDQAQIVHSIIAAWRWDRANLVLSESSLPVKTSLQQFTQQTQARLAQNMVGYANGKVSSTSFSCNGKKIPAYTHTFEERQLQDESKISMYYDQLYFVRDDSVYILSLAQQEKKSIFSNIVWSLGCTSTQQTSK